jgi:rare lipoprotein A (peptidoglycan hydrolase)
MMKALALVAGLVSAIGCYHAETTKSETKLPPISKPAVSQSKQVSKQIIDSANVTWYPGRNPRCSLPSGYIVPQHIPGVAHRTLPKGTELEMTYKGKRVHVVVNDRGPMAPNVDFDISKKVASQLGIIRKGKARVEVRLVKNAPNQNVKEL